MNPLFTWTGTEWRWALNRAPVSKSDRTYFGLHCAPVTPIVTALESLNIILANAVIGPDPRMDGTTDVALVPIDDIECARAAVAREAAR